MSKFKGVKTNNAKTTAKEDIRRMILSQITGEKRVCEIFCGAGEMYRSVWNECDAYFGIDRVKYFDERETFCGDAMKAVSTLDLSYYNIFDIDAYGSPYDILDIVSSRFNDSFKEYAFIITDGSNMDLRLGRVSKGLRVMSGIENHVLKKAASIHEDMISDVIKKIEQRYNGTSSNFIIARGKTGAAMKYYAFKITVNDAV